MSLGKAFRIIQPYSLHPVISQPDPTLPNEKFWLVGIKLILFVSMNVILLIFQPCSKYSGTSYIYYLVPPSTSPTKRRTDRLAFNLLRCCKLMLKINIYLWDIAWFCVLPTYTFWILVCLEMALGQPAWYQRNQVTGLPLYKEFEVLTWNFCCQDQHSTSSRNLRSYCAWNAFLVPLNDPHQVLTPTVYSTMLSRRCSNVKSWLVAMQLIAQTTSIGDRLVYGIIGGKRRQLFDLKR